MKKNEIYRMKAENLGADLEGVCRVDGIPVFVPGLLPGEETLVRIVKSNEHFAFGRIEEAPAALSPDRRENDCPAYPRCGGCTCRHIQYEATLRAKQKQVEDCFARIAHIAVTVPPVIGMDHPEAYRNKTSLPCGGTAEKPVLGFYAPRSHSIIPVTNCPNALPPVHEIADAFLSYMKEYRIEPYREETHKGLVRHIVIRVNRSGESMVTVVLNGKSLPHEEKIEKILKPLGTVTFVINENREQTNVILGSRYRNVFGDGILTDTLRGLTFRLSPASFFQVNPVQTEKLYQTALDFAELRGDEHVCDVYCGAGTISLMMARHCRKVTGIEIVPEAIQNAKENAKLNGIGNADFFAGKAEELLPAMVKDGLRPDVIVTDPPRKGMEESVIEAIATCRPKRLVYVSCNPATQARDAERLANAGYHIQKVQPVDMFAWTGGIENVVLLSQQ